MKHGWLSLVPILVPLLLVNSCRKDPVNQPPVASFMITPDSGDTETLFLLDAAGSYDPDGDDSALEVRWDFENDGFYDWLYVKTRTNINRFESAGSYTVRLQVRDGAGGLATATHQVFVGEGNAAPLIPFAPNPRDSANNIIFGGRLSWVALDPDSDHLRYDLYLGESHDPPLLEKNLPADQYFPDGLLPGKRYFWKVVSRDPGGLTAVSPVWRFSVHSGLYERDTLTDPRDGQKYPVINLNRTWWMARNLNFPVPGNSLCYDNDPQNCSRHGKLYSIYLTDTVVCPPGWRLPTDGDWSSLEQFLGMSRDAGDTWGWIGNDQAYQMTEGGTSGLDLQFSGYADWEGNCHFLNDKAFYSQRSIHRMIIRNYGQVYRHRFNSDNFENVFYAPVRCIRSD